VGKFRKGRGKEVPLSGGARKNWGERTANTGKGQGQNKGGVRVIRTSGPGRGFKEGEKRKLTKKEKKPAKTFCKERKSPHGEGGREPTVHSKGTFENTRRREKKKRERPSKA